MASRAEIVAAEDLVLFVNACFAATGQSEFYGSAGQQALSLRFLHSYMAGNYRRLYARVLAAGVNHHNQQRILATLLAAGAPAEPAARAEEGALIAAALRALPPQRAYKTLAGLAADRVNNRRARAIAAEFTASRRDLVFDAVKYRRHLRAVVGHAHLRLPEELSRFLFEGARRARYQTPLLEAWRRAWHEEAAIYELPYTVAEGFASRRKIPRERFLERIAPRMTAGERARMMQSFAREDLEVKVDLGRMGLTRLALYLLSRPIEEREERRASLEAALAAAAAAVLARRPLRLPRVAAVLDCSYSSSGSAEKRRRPLAVALGVAALLQAASARFTACWTAPTPDPLRVQPRGPTRLAAPLLDALETEPDLVVIVSDGFENDPPGGASEVVRLTRKHGRPDGGPVVIHLNPVFDSERYTPRDLGPHIPVFALRDAEDLPTALQLARLAAGGLSLDAVEAWLGGCVGRLLGGEGAP